VNAGQVIAFLCCLGFLLTLVLGFEVAVFRAACRLCRVSQAGFAKTVGMVVILLVVPSVVDAIFGGALYELYKVANYPLWEMFVVQFFLALPAHMAICSVIHARLMGLPVGEGVAVWLVEKLLKLTLVLVAAGVVAVVVLVRKGV
jgi:hypothetical protein